jgi:cell wall-associated NlpC family hydrolase
MDRRLTPFSGRLALECLRGRIEAPGFTSGQAGQLVVPLADLLDAPQGRRERQLLLGDPLVVIDHRDGHAFVQSGKDGYCGWLTQSAVGAPVPISHWVAVPASHLYSAAKVQAPEIAALSLGARLQVLAVDDKFAKTSAGYVPFAHLRPWGDWYGDPVAVAEGLLAVAYLWGGNSHAGIDCSGLVQAAFRACGLDCPADSDLQQALGIEIGADQPLQRGDLLFWRGHVAMVVDGQRLIHANGHHMAVQYEGIGPCIARIADQGGGPVTARRRPA